MSYQQPAGPAMQVLYSADPNVVQSLKTIRDRVHHVCRHYINQHVRIETIDGHVYEGVIVHCDAGHVYLSVASHTGGRPVSPYYYNNVILPLVLFELLVITLLLL